MADMTKYQLIDWIKKEFQLTYPTMDEVRMNKLEKILSDYDSSMLYRLANMIDRFGFEDIFDAFGLVRL
jgi:hypothetical protein